MRENEREKGREIDATRRDETIAQPACAADCGRLSVETRPRCALATDALLAANGDPSDDAPLTGLRRREVGGVTCVRSANVRVSTRGFFPISPPIAFFSSARRNGAPGKKMDGTSAKRV